MEEGLKKYPNLLKSDIGLLMGKNKKQFGIYLVQGNYKKAQKYVLRYEKVAIFAKKLRQVLGK